MKESAFFAVEYKGNGIECPYHLSGNYNHPEWEWDGFESNPMEAPIHKEYIFRVADQQIKDISFDYYGVPDNIVSQQFLAVCTGLHVTFRAVPLKIILPRKATTQKTYFLFLIAEHRALLDRDRSEFAEELNVETGGTLYSKVYPPHPVYSWIKHFVPQSGPSPHLFRCVELMRLICTREFRDKAYESKLKCVTFTPLDDFYRYDPWEEIS